MSIVLLGGSPSPQSSCSRLLLHIGEKLALHGHRTARLEVRELPGPALLRADTADPELARAVALVRDADALVVATPIYKASYTGILKLFLDLLPQDGLAGKLVLPIATGGSQSHLLALDYALRPVLASMWPRSILPSIYATSEQVGQDSAAGLRLAPPIAVRVADGVDQLAAELQALAARAVARESRRTAPIAA
ncbi:NADPH-dependent FMN reductase [Massilia niastensis]|uniref:NADPH-dependent FMN reductase n=1 Tax=Massilia niastensis TaxID=544911 RepID=UPI000594BBA0|nr:NADPH-dependent FMN reductase [Massilia niastensis]